MINASPDPQPPPLAHSQHGSLNGEWQLFPASTFSAAKRRCLLPVLRVHTNTLDDCLSLSLPGHLAPGWLLDAGRGVRGGVRCWGVGGNHKISGDCIWCCHIAGSLISSWCHVIELLLWRSVPLAVHYSELCLISPRSDSQRYLREHVEHSLPAASVLVKPPDVPPNDIPPFYLFPRDRWVTGSQRASKHESWKPAVICTGGCALCHSPAQTCRQCWKRQVGQAALPGVKSSCRTPCSSQIRELGITADYLTDRIRSTPLKVSQQWELYHYRQARHLPSGRGFKALIPLIQLYSHFCESHWEDCFYYLYYGWMLFQIPYKPQLCAWSDSSVVREVRVLYRHDRLPQTCFTTILLTVYFRFPWATPHHSFVLLFVFCLISLFSCKSSWDTYQFVLAKWFQHTPYFKNSTPSLL